MVQGLAGREQHSVAAHDALHSFWAMFSFLYRQVQSGARNHIRGKLRLC